MIVIINTAIARDLGYVVDNPNLGAFGINPNLHAIDGNSLSRESHNSVIELFPDETSMVYAAERKTFRADPGRRRLVTIRCLSSIVVSADIADRCSIIAVPSISVSNSPLPTFQFFPAVANRDGIFVLEGRISGDVRKGLIVGKAIVVLHVGDYENASEITDSIEQYAHRMTEQVRELRSLIERCRSVMSARAINIGDENKTCE